jgi:hypothetical protein
MHGNRRIRRSANVGAINLPECEPAYGPTFRNQAILTLGRLMPRMNHHLPSPVSARFCAATIIRTASTPSAIRAWARPPRN